MNPSHLLLCLVQLDEFLFDLLSFIVEIILLSLQFLALRPQMLLGLLQLRLLHLVLSVSTLYLVEHLVNPRHFIAKPCVLFHHVVLQVSKLLGGRLLLLLVQELLHLMRLSLVNDL